MSKNERGRSSNWVLLRGVDRPRLNDARLQAHHAIQWLARAARAYVPPQSDDGHTNMGWDPALGGFTTHPLKDGSWLSLKLIGLTLALHGGEVGAPVHSLSLNGRTDALVRQWLGEQLGARGFDALALDAPAPYEIPAHAVAEGAPYDLVALTDALAELGAWFGNAALSLASILSLLIARGFDALALDAPAPYEIPAHAVAEGAPHDLVALTDALAELGAWFGNAAVSLASIQSLLIARGCSSSPVRCWPHHFDIASLTTLPAQSAGSAKYIGAGLSPGDEYYDEPYFYVSVYPEPDPKLLPTLPMLGHWHERDFVAAVATASRILKAKNHEAETDSFLSAAVGEAFKVLS